LQPRLIPLSPSAKAEWILYVNDIEGQLGDGQVLEPIRGFAAKAGDHVARIAGVQTILHNPDSGGIGLESVQAAICLMDFYLTEALRIHATGMSDPALQLAERLRLWCVGKTTVCLPEIYQSGPSGIRDADSARKAVNTLVKHGWLIRLPEGSEVNGVRRREVWRVIS
jgi:hypothetical protein